MLGCADISIDEIYSYFVIGAVICLIFLNLLCILRADSADLRARNTEGMLVHRSLEPPQESRFQALGEWDTAWNGIQNYSLASGKQKWV